MTEAAAKAESATAKPKDSNTRLGLEIVPVTPDLRAHYGSTDGRGVLVGHVDAGSPAQLAGIKVGDLLLEIGGKSIATGADVMSALASAGSNRTLPATVLRNHKRQEVTVYLDQPLPILGELVRMFTIPQPTCT
jgi:S1-C subfamily serine protease